MSQSKEPCPCGRIDEDGRAVSLADCCGRWIAGEPAPDAEALMRSRYTAHVLRDNYSQTLALSLMEMDAPGELEPHAQFIARLEAEGRLDRAVEGLPSPAEILVRQDAGLGLTRPELAVLLAYGKLELKREMAESDVADDPWFEVALESYFLGRCATTTRP